MTAMRDAFKKAGMDPALNDRDNLFDLAEGFIHKYKTAQEASQYFLRFVLGKRRNLAETLALCYLETVEEIMHRTAPLAADAVPPATAPQGNEPLINGRSFPAARTRQ